MQVPADIYAVTASSSSSAAELGLGDVKRRLPAVEAVEGDNATLECRAGGIPVPTITWVSRHCLQRHIISILSWNQI